MFNLFNIVLPLMVFSNITSAPIKDSEPEIVEQANSNNDAITVGTLTGVGLVAVGGAGSIVISINNKKEKNVPSKEIKNEIEGE